MPISLDSNMMREIIMDHYSNPLNKRKPENLDGYLTIRMDSDSCVDDITIYLKVEDDKIKEAMFDGVACAISTASTDILCGMIEGKTKEEALYIIKQYENMIFEKEYDDSCLEELVAFHNTHKQAARIKCATIGFRGVESLLEPSSEDNKNEQ